MGKMKQIDSALADDLLDLEDFKAENGIGGRGRLSMEALLETEELIRELGHYGAAEKLEIRYHAVRYRMRRLMKMRGEKLAQAQAQSGTAL